MYLNHWAVFVCALSNLALGAIWYSKALFFNVWKKEVGLDEEQMNSANFPKIYGLAFLFAWIVSYNLAFFLGDAKTDATWGATAGFLAGFGFSTLGFAIIGLFEQRSWRYLVINGGFLTIWFTLIGLIIGAWRS